MYAARNFFKAHNVSSHPMKDVNGSVEFLSKYTDSLIVCAVLEHFGMDDVDSEPTKNVYDKDTMEPTEYVRKQLNLIVDTFAIHEGPDFTAEPSKLVCPHCKKEYLQLQGLRKHMKNKHNSSGTAVESSTGKEDSIFNYSCAALSMCLLWKDFEDARKHGDGERTIRLYKFLMLYFKLANKTKYTYHSLRLLAQVKCILSPRLSHQLIWNRCVNNVGHEDTNSEVDRENEHHNRVFKCECGHFHGKISDASVGRISHSAQACEGLLALSFTWVFAISLVLVARRLSDKWPCLKARVGAKPGDINHNNKELSLSFSFYCISIFITLKNAPLLKKLLHLDPNYCIYLHAPPPFTLSLSLSPSLSISFQSLSLSPLSRSQSLYHLFCF